MLKNSNIRLNKNCNGPLQCKKSSTLYTVVDNTGTRFTWTMEIELTFTDGSTTIITQTPTAGWTQQLNQWVTIFGDVVSEKCSQSLVEARCNILPNGCGGLLPPPTELQGTIPEMFARYLQILACPTCPALTKATVISVNGNPFNRNLALKFVEGREKRYDLCQECGEEGKLFYQGTNIEVPEEDLPICLFDCAEVFPKTPEAACNFQLIEVCDIDRPTDTTYIQFADCGDGQIINAYFFVNTDGALEEYAPNEGSIGPCGSEVSSTVLCDECGNLIEVVTYDDGTTLYYSYSEKEGRGDLTFPIGELGKCDCKVNQWFEKTGCTINHPEYPDGTKVRWFEGLDCNNELIIDDNIYLCSEEVVIRDVQDGCTVFGEGGVYYGSDNSGVDVASLTSDGTNLHIEGINTLNSWIITNQLDLLENITTSNQIYRINGWKDGVEIFSLWVDRFTLSSVISYDKDSNPHPIDVVVGDLSVSECSALNIARQDTPDIIPTGNVFFDKIGVRSRQVNGSVVVDTTDISTVIQIGFDNITCNCNEDICTDWETREGETCNDPNYPDGTVVQWIEGIDCDGNVVYPSGEIEYTPWGGTGITGSPQPSLVTLGGVGIVEGLESATSNSPCVLDSSMVTGLPNAQTWVNFDIGDTVEGQFSNAWASGFGGEILFETQWSTTQQWIVELEFSDGTYSSPINITSVEWVNIGTQFNAYQFDDNCNTGAGTGQHMIYQASFSDFGVTTEQVVGIRVEFGPAGSGDPDFAGAYITDSALLSEVTVFDEQPTSVVPCGKCVPCEVSEKTIIGCSVESTTEVNVGDQILTVFEEDCNKSPVGDPAQYNISDNNTLLTIPVFTEQCDPQPDLETTSECIKDTEGMEWTELQLIDPNNPTNATFLYYNKDTKELGTPAGDSSQWTSCEEDCTKLCDTYLTDCGFCCSVLVGTGGGGIQTGTDFSYGGFTGNTWNEFTDSLENGGFSWEFKTIYNTDGLPLADGNLLEICGPVDIGVLAYTTALGPQVLNLTCNEKQALNIVNKESSIPEELITECPQDCRWGMLYMASGLSGGMTDILFNGVSIYADLGYSGYTSIAGTQIYTVLENLETWLISNEDPSAVAQLVDRDSYELNWFGEGPIEIVGDGGVPQTSVANCGEPDKALRAVICNVEDLKSDCCPIQREACIDVGGTIFEVFQYLNPSTGLISRVEDVVGNTVATGDADSKNLNYVKCNCDAEVVYIPPTPPQLQVLLTLQE